MPVFVRKQGSKKNEEMERQRKGIIGEVKEEDTSGGKGQALRLR